MRTIKQTIVAIKAFNMRFTARLRLIINHGEELNRRVEIENHLLEVAAGKKPLPDRNTCRILALRLGTPKASWSEQLKKNSPNE